MSVYCAGYLEAKLDGKWRHIGYFQREKSGELKMVPIINGQSTILSLFRDCSAWQPVTYKYIDQEMLLSYFSFSEEEKDKLDKVLEYATFYVCEGRDLRKYVDIKPACCGFFLKSDVYQLERDPGVIEYPEYLSAQEYEALSEEAKKAYMYYEYMDPYGDDMKMKQLAARVSDCIDTFNDSCIWDKDDWNHNWPEISFEDCRIVAFVE